MTFQNPITGNNGTLVRAQIKSPDYVAGVSGWIIKRDGSAEFNNLNVRGTFATGTFHNGVTITGHNGFSEIDMGSSDPAEVLPPNFSSTSDLSGNILLSMISGDSNGGTIQFTITSPSDSPVGSPGEFALDASGNNASVVTPINITNAAIRLADTADASLSSTQHAFQIGDDSSFNLIIDNNEIIARNNGAASPLFVNQTGGGYASTPMRHIEYDGSGNVTTTSTSYVTDNTNGPHGTFPYPPSGVVTFLWSADVDNSGATSALMTIRVRDTNASGTIRATGAFNRSIHSTAGIRQTSTLMWTVTGLPTSGTGFVEGLYLSSLATSTATFRNTIIVVQPSP